MAAPAFSTATAQGSGTATTTCTVTLPTTAANDILILITVNGGATAAPTLSTGTFTQDANWSTISASTWTTGYGAAYWVRCTGNHSGQTQIVSGTTDSVCALVVRITGAITTGNPFEGATGTNLGAVDGGALTGFTTTADETLVCYVGAVDDNQTRSSPTIGGNAMSNLSVASSSGGADSGVWYADSTKATAGATGNFDITNSAGTAQGKRVMAFAMLATRQVILGAASATSSATLTGLSRSEPVPLGSSDGVASATLALSVPSGITARTFDGVDDEIRTSIGACNLNGAYTLAVLARKKVDGATDSTFFITNHSSIGVAVLGIATNASDQLIHRTRTSTTTVTVADDWVLLAISRPAGSGQTTRAHIYKGGSWVHENLSSTLSNAASQAGGNIRFATIQDADWSAADIAVAAEWNVELSDAQVQELSAGSATQAWYDNSGATPLALWNFDQASVGTALTDETGGGADQSAITGTTVNSDGPAGWDYTVTLAGPDVPLEEASGVCSATLGVTAPTRVPLGVASATCSATLAVSVPSGITARHFDGFAGDVITCSIGACSITGAASIACLIRRTDFGGLEQWIGNHTSGGSIGSMKLGQEPAADGENPRGFSVNAHSPFDFSVGDGWGIIVITKSSGNVIPDFHHFVGGSWSHGAADFDCADAAATVGGSVKFGTLSGILYSSMDLAVAAEWDVELSDSQVEELSANLKSQDWMDCSAGTPKGLWNFDQASTATAITDATGNGADQTAISGTSVNGDGPVDWDYTISAAAEIPLAAASGVCSATFALTAPTQVVLVVASAAATGTLALTVATKVVLGTASCTASATLALSATTKVVLGTASCVSSATLALTAPAKLTLAAASGVSSATLSLTAPAKVTLAPASCVSSATLALFAPGEQIVPLGAASAVSSATLSLTAAGQVVLGPATATSSATLALTAKQPVVLGAASALCSATLALTAATKVVLGTSTAASSATLALTAATKIVLASASATSSATLTLTAPAIVPLGAASAQSSATLTVYVPTGEQVPCNPASAVSSATLTLTAVPRLSLSSSGVSSATLLLTAQTRVVLAASSAISTATLVVYAPEETVIPLEAASGQSSASLVVYIFFPAPPTPVPLGAVELNAETSGAEAVEASLGAQEQNAVLTGAMDSEAVRAAVAVESVRSAQVVESVTGGVEVSLLGAVELNVPRGVTPLNEEVTGGTAGNLKGVVELNDQDTAGEAETMVLAGVDDGSRSGVDDETTTGGNDNP